MVLWYRLMHELGIAIGLADATWESAREAGLTRVHLVRVAVGALSGVDPAALASAWELTRERPELQTAQVQCEYIPVSIFCHSCCRTVQPNENWRLICPLCQIPSSDVRTGRELHLVQLEGE